MIFIDILDEDFNQWLIEVNTNPCLEESSELLKSLLPRMIEDLLKLTVDITFPKNSIKKTLETIVGSHSLKVFQNPVLKNRELVHD